MSKVTIEFNTEEPHEQLELRRALKATEAYLVIHGMYNHLRSICKYGEDEQRAEFAEEMRQVLYALEEQYGINTSIELE